MSGIDAHLARVEWLRVGVALLGGLVAGVAAKWADEAGIGEWADLGTYAGAWVVAITLIAAFSRRWLDAVLRTVAFMLTALVAYYAYAVWVLDFSVPSRLVVGWLALALILVPPFSIIAWYSRRGGWLATLGVAVPVGVLLAEAYTFVRVLPLHQVQFVFNLVSAVLLLVILARGHEQRLRTLVLVLPVAIVVAPILDRMWSVVAQYI